MAGINFITAKEGFRKHFIQTVYLNKHTRLVGRVGGEGMGPFGWNGCVTLDQDGHDPASGLNTQGQGGDVQQKQVLDILRLVTRQDGSLDS